MLIISQMGADNGSIIPVKSGFGETGAVVAAAGKYQGVVRGKN